MRARCAWLALAASAVGLVSGCAAGVRGTSRELNTYRVVIEGFVFRPARLEVVVGDTIEWVNADPFDHTATEAGKTFDSGILGKDGRAVFMPIRSGTYAYQCALHPTMEGVVLVR